MLIVATRIRQAGSKGVGLFADEKIPAGETFWLYDARFDLTVKVGFDTPQHTRSFLEKYATLQPDGWYQLCADNARFMNHSERPNTRAIKRQGRIMELVAARDIAAGEELTCDYREHCENCRTELGFENLERKRRRAVRI